MIIKNYGIYLQGYLHYLGGVLLMRVLWCVAMRPNLFEIIHDQCPHFLKSLNLSSRCYKLQHTHEMSYHTHTSHKHAPWLTKYFTAKKYWNLESLGHWDQGDGPLVSCTHICHMLPHQSHWTTSRLPADFYVQLIELQRLQALLLPTWPFCVYFKHIEGEIKWPQFCRWKYNQIQSNFLERKLLYFEWNSIEVRSKGSIWK